MRAAFLFAGLLSALSLREHIRTERQNVLGEAHAYLTHLRLRPDPEDCSDFVQKVYAPYKKLPRSSGEMAKTGRVVPSRKDLHAGDLVFFSGERLSNQVGHVGIYAGRGKFIHKPSSRPVSMDTLFKGYYGKRYLGGRSVLPAPITGKGSGASAPKRAARRR